MQHGRYTVNRKLAEGGMAEIFLAKQHGSQGFEKPVVLKRIHAALYADEQFRNMLIDEAHICMGLMHNNIVQILDLGQAGGRYFLVLELIEGWDLGNIIRRATDLQVGVPPELGLYIVAQVCRALGYAHGKTNADGKHLGIVHRDVSPQNVLISEQGDVKLADFGIAKARRKRESTETGVVKGKIAFMSPEQALGQELDARSDLYSLGTLLYLLVLGRRPYEGATDLEVLLRVQGGESTSPISIMPDLHPAVVTVIERAMQFDRDQRYGSADEMLADIEGALRSAFSSAGQTELKHWLAELSRLDGQMPIGRAMNGAETLEILSGEAELASGENVVLGEGSAHGVEPTLLRETQSLKPRVARMTGAEATVADLRIAPTWIDQETPVAIRSTAPSGGWSFGVMAVIAVALVATAAGVWKVMRSRDSTRASESSAAATVPALPAETPPPVADKEVAPKVVAPLVEKEPAPEPPAVAAVPERAPEPTVKPAPAPKPKVVTTVAPKVAPVPEPVRTTPIPPPPAPPSATTPPDTVAPIEPSPAPTEPLEPAAPPAAPPSTTIEPSAPPPQAPPEPPPQPPSTVPILAP